MVFHPQCTTTGIGSVPYTDAEAACSLILSTIPEIPVWPQLPKADFREQMEIQFSEGMPRVVLDKEKQRIYFETGGDDTSDLEKFYENVLEENLDSFRISPEFGRGIYALEKKLDQEKPAALKYIKSQVTGPVTFGLAVVDENKRALYYNEMFRDVVVKGIAMKARWILNRFKPFGTDQLCFIDEPILSAFGSSTYVSVQRSDVVNHIREVIEAVHGEGALAGAHCCGNTEWTILIDAGVDIISFDAYGFGETIGYYPDEVREFLEKGGSIAWGIVPTSSKITEETPDSLAKRLNSEVENLAGKGIKQTLIWDQCLLTPSCGTGPLSVELSERVFHQLAQLSEILRR